MGFSLKKAFKKVKKVAKKIEKAGSKGFKKVLPKKVYKAASKVVRNPIFQTVALSVATAGVGGMLQASGKSALQKVGGKMLAKTAGKTLAQKGVMSSLIKKSAISAVKKEAGKAVIKKAADKYVANKTKANIRALARKAPIQKTIRTVQKQQVQKVNQMTPQINRAGTVVAAMTAAAIPAAAKIQQQGGDVKTALLNSQLYKDTVTVGTNEAIRPQVIAQLKAQGVPDSQLNIAADAVIDSMATKAVEQKKEGAGLGTMALVAVPLLFALIGG